jgi:hypothetical protein
MENNIAKPFTFSSTQTSRRLVVLALTAARMQAARSGRWAQPRTEPLASLSFLPRPDSPDRARANHLESLDRNVEHNRPDSGEDFSAIG